MKFKVFITVVFFLFVFKVLATQPTHQLEYDNAPQFETLNSDSLLHGIFKDSISTPKTPNLSNVSNKTSIKTPDNSTIHKPEETKIVEPQLKASDTIVTYIIPEKLRKIHVDSLLFLANPFFIELVYNGLPFDFKWNIQPDYRTLYYGGPATTLSDFFKRPVKDQSAESTVASLRQYAREQIIRNAANLYVTIFDELPDPEVYTSHLIKGKSFKNMRLDLDDQAIRHRRINVRREQMGPWIHKATALAQFSQNYVSPNWYQGGNSNVAILGIITGQLNYDNKKSVQWENWGEWHMGFNSVAGDKLHSLSTNDDVFKLNSKLGIKAGGNFFYSTLVDFSTQFFNSYDGINSNVMKTSFLTPVRLNVGVGLDYKYKKMFSLMISPVSYKYIYVNDSKNVDPNLFGIKTGDRVLSEIGSSFNAIFCLPVSHEIQLDSKLNFYSNYQSVVVDYELVCNMIINRFMSTRISINSRYDTSVISLTGEPSKVQFKQLLSVGFSHKFN